MASLNLPRETLAEFCRTNHIIRLSRFASAGAFDNATGSIDFLVEFVPEYVPSFLHLAEMESVLSGLLERRPISFKTPMELTQTSLQDVRKNAEVLYARE
jgi:predicted nucleotidyltransferase